MSEMGRTASKGITYSSTLEKRLNVFYVLAFLPLILIAYFNVFNFIIPMYALILLLLKMESLSSYREANSTQRALGFIVIFGSFLLYYALVIFFPRVVFYGAVNYAIHILGLFLIFFDVSALKQAFTPLFLIVAATSSSFVTVWIKPYLTPYITFFASSIGTLLKLLGMYSFVDYSGRFPVIAIRTQQGAIFNGLIVWECVGFYSTMVFSVILVVMLFDDPSSRRTKLLWSIVGILGNLIVNIIRVIVIFLTVYFYGSDMGGQVHYVIGYTLFITWLIVFFYLFSNRQTIQGKIQFVRQKISPEL